MRELLFLRIVKIETIEHSGKMKLSPWYVASRNDVMWEPNVNRYPGHNTQEESPWGLSSPKWLEMSCMP